MNSIWERLKKRNRTDFFILILLGVMLMIVALPSGTGTDTETETGTQKEESAVQTQEEYQKKLEEKLERLLEKMDGVGKARVMVTFSDEGEDTLDKDTAADGEKEEETTVVYDTGEGEQPYVIRRQTPHVAGIVVVAEGGGSAQTATEITELVCALFSIETHQVRVVKMLAQTGSD